MKRHINGKPLSSNPFQQPFSCNHCNSVFKNYDGLINDVIQCHPLLPQQTGEGPGIQQTTNQQQSKSADHSKNMQPPDDSIYVANDHNVLENAVLNRLHFRQNDERYGFLLLCPQL